MKHTALWSLAALLALSASGCYQASTTQSASSATATAATESAASPKVAEPSAAAAAPAAANEMTLAGGLKYTDLKVGDGDIAEAGLKATVHYTGWLTDGTKFDSSVDRGQPFQFQIGAGQVIRGWDEGVKGMRIGGKRHLTIPSDMGYGSNGVGPIPANATLVFDVELLGLAR